MSSTNFKHLPTKVGLLGKKRKTKKVTETNSSDSADSASDLSVEDLTVRVKTLDSVHDFTIQKDSTGGHLFEKVTTVFGIESGQFFGLIFVNSEGRDSWLRMQLKVLSQKVGKGRPIEMKLRVRFFPEDVRDLQDYPSQKLLYLQVKEAILTGELRCPVDSAVLLASYSAQVQLGDYTAESRVDTFLDSLLPASIQNKHDVSVQDLARRVLRFYKDYKGMTREKAMMEYLKTAEKLETFGVVFFDIRNKKGTELKAGVDYLGLHIYEYHNVLKPKLGFPWNEIESVILKKKKFTIKLRGKTSPKFSFYVQRVDVSRDMLACCVGYHDLFIRRRSNCFTGASLPSGETASSIIREEDQKNATDDDDDEPNAYETKTDDVRVTECSLNHLAAKQENGTAPKQLENDAERKPFPENLHSESTDEKRDDVSSEAVNEQEVTIVFLEDGCSSFLSPPQNSEKDHENRCTQTYLQPAEPGEARNERRLKSAEQKDKDVKSSLPTAISGDTDYFVDGRKEHTTNVGVNVKQMDTVEVERRTETESGSTGIPPPPPLPRTSVLREDNLGGRPNEAEERSPEPNRTNAEESTADVVKEEKRSGGQVEKKYNLNHSKIEKSKADRKQDEISTENATKEDNSTASTAEGKAKMNGDEASERKYTGHEHIKSYKKQLKIKRKQYKLSPVFEDGNYLQEPKIKERKGSVRWHLYNLEENQSQDQLKDVERQPPFDYVKLKKLFENLSNQDPVQLDENEKLRDKCDKFKSLRNIECGLTKSRVAIFESL